ncbi:MAG TPA: site-2 protease family protein, partial [Balneolaceae bacterium]|nr:site-2 protease family protein [Balneolaceae bacterium]
VSGIKIRIHWTFFLLIPWVAFLVLLRGGTITSLLWNLLFIGVLFVCVVLHELGHALTAARYNISTSQITLLPIGGVASLKSMPDDPRQELMVAIAGPVVNITIAILLYLIFPVQSFLAQDPEKLKHVLTSVNGSNFYVFLFLANAMLAVFNLIPAFPMDGGRVLRAALSMKMNRVQATRIAAQMGQAIAFLFFFIGLFVNPLLILIAIFVYFGAQGENLMVQQLELLKGRKVRDAMMTNITTLRPEDSLHKAVELTLSGTERDFIVMGEQGVQGVLLQKDMIRAVKNKKMDLAVGDIMHKDFQVFQAGDDMINIYQKVHASSDTFFPVMEQGRLAGAIDIANINEFMIFRPSLDF